MAESPYVAPDKKNSCKFFSCCILCPYCCLLASGIFGAAVGLISGSSEMEELICAYCKASNGEQPKDELKRL